jgi:pyruvate kinase
MSSNTQIAGFREHTGLLMMQEAEQHRAVLRLEDEILASQGLFVAAGDASPSYN